LGNGLYDFLLLADASILSGGSNGVKHAAPAEPGPILASASIGLSLIAIGAFTWGYAASTDSMLMPARVATGVLIAGWQGLLLSLFMAIAAVARCEGARAGVAFATTLACLTISFVAAIASRLLT
jgi:hypothetical protein